jgi:alkylation response protein AidB-like acyl-CoA dehydrogenase
MTRRNDADAAERELLTRTIGDWLTDHLDLLAVIEAVEPPELTPAVAEFTRQAAQLGWLGAGIPAEHGGIGLALPDVAAVVEALGAGAAPGPYLGSMLAAEAIRLAGTPDQQARYLPSIAGGSAMATVAGFHPESLEVTAESAALSGHAGVVGHAAEAGVLVVAARPEGRAEVRLWLCDPTAPGVHLTATDSVDRTWRAALVELRGAPAEPLGETANEYSRFQSHGTVLVAADLVGVAGRAIRLSTEYAKIRHQFGRPIGSFQAIKHRLVDAHMATAMARKGVQHAARLLAAAGEPAGIDHVPASVAKAKANDAARAAAEAAIQVHGAMGFTWSHPAHLLYKRAMRQAYEFGDTAWHLDRVAADYLGPAEETG